MVGSMLFIAASQTTAYGLEFPMTTRLTLPASKNLTVGGNMPSVALISQTSEMALVAYAMEQVHQAREELGAKRVARAIMNTEYSWGDEQYSCLNRLWTKESNWNYKARNKRTGAHGIPQALPADKMDVVGTDWRTNPVTQIRWGLRYIDIRYDTPCSAWAKFKRSRFY
ncbi:MAG: hypothetical protein RL130_133 [Actinomycetota bacterium]